MKSSNAISYREARPCDYGLDSRQRFSLAFVDLFDKSVCVGTAQHFSIELVLEFQIIQKLRRSRDDLWGISARRRLANISIILAHCYLPLSATDMTAFST